MRKEIGGMSVKLSEHSEYSVNAERRKDTEIDVVLVAEGDFRTLAGQREAVEGLLAGYFGHTVEIAHTDGGAPFIPGFTGYVSISHCAVAVALAISARPIGVDIEGHRYEKMRRIARRFVSERTIATDIESATMLAAIWCAKEAVYKLYRGEGLASHITVDFPGYKHNLTIKHTKSYTLAIAKEK